jgi:nitrite reductase/ring-hydroxylating ferredoxin subunit
MPEIFVGLVEEFDKDTRIIVSSGSSEIGVFRVADQFFAFQNRCLHQGGPVCEGIVVGKVEAVLDGNKCELSRRFSMDVNHIVCPWHGWEYNIETGQFAGDSSMGLRKYPVRVEANQVFVTVR